MPRCNNLNVYVLSNRDSAKINRTKRKNYAEQNTKECDLLHPTDYSFHITNYRTKIAHILDIKQFNKCKETEIIQRMFSDHNGTKLEMKCIPC
jgi:hypothetical protein